MHITLSLLEAVGRGELPPRVLFAIGKEHLSAICPTCAEAIAAYEAGARSRRGASPEAYQGPLEAVRRRLALRERQFRAEERIARAWVREILALAPGKRCGRIEGAYKRFRGLLFGTLLLEEARKAVPQNPGESLSLADAVLVSCRKTSPDDPDPEIFISALAVRGNALRALGRFREAEGELQQARRLLESSQITDVAIAAELDSYLGSLRKNQGRLDQAVRYLHQAAALYRMIGDRTRAARQFMKLGTVHYRRSEIEAALDATEKARGLFEADASLFLRAGVQYNLAHYLHAAGRVDEAEAELADHADLLEEAGEWMEFYVGWLRARIAWSRSDLRRAEALFRETRSRSTARGIAFDTSLVSLELALVHLAQGRTGLVKRLAREALRVFADQQVEREVLAALELIEAAARRQDLTREMIEKAVVFLESARHARRESHEPS